MLFSNRLPRRCFGPTLLPSCGLLALILLLGPAPTSASVVQYKLSNHPDGNQTPPHYGLRLDELYDVTGGHDVFTFDFEHAQSQMVLEYDTVAQSIHIYGQVFGGLDTGVAYDGSLSGLWSVDFTYANLSDPPDTLDVADPEHPDLKVVNKDATDHTGSITPLFSSAPIVSGTAIDLYDQDDGNFSFRFTDEGSHRLPGGWTGPQIVGWGWLNHHDPDVHVYSSDWIFTGRMMPEPSALLVWTGLAAVGLISWAGRRTLSTTTRPS